MKINQFDNNKKKTGLWKTNIGTDAIVDIIIHDRMPAFVSLPVFSSDIKIFSWKGHYHEDREVGLWEFYGESGRLVAEHIYIT